MWPGGPLWGKLVRAQWGTGDTGVWCWDLALGWRDTGDTGKVLGNHADTAVALGTLVWHWGYWCGTGYSAVALG